MLLPLFRLLVHSIRKISSAVLVLAQVFLGNHGQGKDAPIAVLFSGGLDSMIIAALLHQCIDSVCKYSFKLQCILFLSFLKKKFQA